LRCLAVGGSARVDPRSCALATPGRPPALLDGLAARASLHAGYGRRPDHEPVAAPAVRAVGGRLGGVSGRRVPPVTRRLDSRAARQRFRDRRAARAAGARGCAAARVLQRDRADVGAPLARRGPVGGAPALSERDSVAANIAEWTETNK